MGGGDTLLQTVHLLAEALVLHGAVGNGRAPSGQFFPYCRVLLLPGLDLRLGAGLFLLAAVESLSGRCQGFPAVLPEVAVPGSQGVRELLR